MVGRPGRVEELVGRFRGLVVAIARSFRLAPDDADVLQQTWLQLFESIDRVREPERVGGVDRHDGPARVPADVGHHPPRARNRGVDRGDGTGTFPALEEELISTQERTAVRVAVRRCRIGIVG
ncbi:MAG TPA: hypothetical protein VK923_11860 [Euzebyales bacterium]|nr:hypothetical protein [Euzebyales bacterium]